MLKAGWMLGMQSSPALDLAFRRLAGLHTLVATPSELLTAWLYLR